MFYRGLPFHSLNVPLWHVNRNARISNELQCQTLFLSVYFSSGFFFFFFSRQPRAKTLDYNFQLKLSLSAGCRPFLTSQNASCHKRKPGVTNKVSNVLYIDFIFHWYFTFHFSFRHESDFRACPHSTPSKSNHICVCCWLQPKHVLSINFFSLMLCFPVGKLAFLLFTTCFPWQIKSTTT